MSLRSLGQNDAANLVKNVTQTTPTRALKYKNAFEDSLNHITPLTKNKALSILVEAKITKHQYNIIREQANKKNYKLYPLYYVVRQAKKECFPDAQFISISENVGEIKLQSLLDYTIQRILIVQSDVIKTLPYKQLNKLFLISKWGFDGSSGLSQYKQKFDDQRNLNNDNGSNASIFLTSFVPIQLINVDPKSTNKSIIW
jgi:hypothetical protein